jgi:hypothetical protein
MLLSSCCIQSRGLFELGYAERSTPICQWKYIDAFFSAAHSDFVDADACSVCAISVGDNAHNRSMVKPLALPNGQLLPVIAGGGPADGVPAMSIAIANPQKVALDAAGNL